MMDQFWRDWSTRQRCLRWVSEFRWDWPRFWCFQRPCGLAGDLPTSSHTHWVIGKRVDLNQTLYNWNFSMSLCFACCYSCQLENLEFSVSSSTSSPTGTWWSLVEVGEYPGVSWLICSSSSISCNLNRVSSQKKKRKSSPLTPFVTNP